LSAALAATAGGSMPRWRCAARRVSCRQHCRAASLERYRCVGHPLRAHGQQGQQGPVQRFTPERL